MGDLFTELGRRVDDNARREIEVYDRELPEYAALRGSARDETLDFAVWLRRRTTDLACDNSPLTDDDLAHIALVGERRGEKGMSHGAHQRVLALHTSLMLRDIHEASGPHDRDGLMRLVRWFGPQDTRGGDAYMGGYAEGQNRQLSLLTRVQMLARSLLADVLVAPKLASSVGMRLHRDYVVTVVRVPDRPRVPDARREAAVEILLRRHMLPVTWQGPDELVALVPGDGAEPVSERVLRLARDLAAALGLPCAVGTSTGRLGALADALARARSVGRVAPLEAVPHRVHTLPDLFVELGVVQLPQVDAWLRDMAGKLTRGPDLIATLDAYYRNDMRRPDTAAALNIHPRTLDYRLQRVRDLLGMDPGSTRGVRTLTAAVTRALATTPDG